MKTIGSQKREPISETDYELVCRNGGSVTLRDKTNGRKELWYLNDHHAGYTIEIDGLGYEFVTSIFSL